MANATCAISGCDKKTAARGWCSMHYTRNARYGDPEHRMPGEIRDGRKICPSCEQDVAIEDYSPGASYCRSCVAAKKRAKELTKRATRPFVPLPAIYCIQCGTYFQQVERRSFTCSDECRTARQRAMDTHYANRDGGVSAREATRRWSRANPEKAAVSSHSHRARKHAAFVERVVPSVVYERDSWSCRICGDPIPKDAKSPDPLSASVDHRIPLSRGGEHSYSNCQASHLRCNVSKGNRVA